MKCALTVTHLCISAYSPAGAGERRMPVADYERYTTLDYGKRYHANVKCRFSVLARALAGTHL